MEAEYMAQKSAKRSPYFLPFVSMSSASIVERGKFGLLSRIMMVIRRCPADSVLF
jgi:hypothetical protein